MKKIILLVTLLTSYHAQATIYQWKDDNGITHFSDDENKVNSEKKKVKVISPHINQLSIPKSQQKQVSISQPSIFPERLSIAFVSPTHQQTIRNNIGEINITANLSSALSEDQYIRLLIDGVIINTQTTPSFNVTGIPLGEHKLQLQLISQSGKILALSQLVTIYMHRFKAG